MSGIISFRATGLSMLPDWQRSAALGAVAGAIPR
jgi:hypothetical protein